MLDVIVRCQEAVLQDDHETLTVIQYAVRQVFATGSMPVDVVSEGNVKALLAFAVQTHEVPLVQRSFVNSALPMTIAGTRDAYSAQSREETFANWVFSLSQTLNATHPQAVQMLRDRLLGLDSREIAARHELPRLLVQRLFDALSSSAVFDINCAGAEV